MEEQLVNEIDSLLYCYIHCNALKAYNDVAMSYNLGWIRNLSGIEVDKNEVEEQTMESYRQYCLSKVAALIKAKWAELELYNSDYSQDESIFVHTYKNLFLDHLNGRRVLFRLAKIDGELLLNNIEDEINPDHDYGFELPTPL